MSTTQVSSLQKESSNCRKQRTECLPDDPATPDQALPKRNTAPPPQSQEKNRRADFFRRGRSPPPEWNTPWNPNDWKDGRVLVIDYLGRGALQQAHAPFNPHSSTQPLTQTGVPR